MENQNEHPEEVVESQEDQQIESTEANEEQPQAQADATRPDESTATDLADTEPTEEIATNVEPDNVESPESTPAPSTPTPKPKTKKIVLITILATVVALAVAGALVYFLVLRKKPAPATQTANSQTVTPKKTEAIGTPSEVATPTGTGYTYVQPIQIDPGVNWQKPSATDLQGFYTNEQKFTQDQTEFTDGVNYVNYYLAGTFSGGKVYYVAHPNQGPGSQTLDVFMQKDSDNKVTWLYRYLNPLKYSAFTDTAVLDQYLLNKEKVQIDTSSVFAGTIAPDNIVVSGQKMKLPAQTVGDATTGIVTYTYNTGSIIIDNSNPGTPVSTIPEGTVYEITTAKDGYKLSLFELEMPNHFRVSYQIDGEISRSDVPPITWTDGSKNTSQYASFGSGCGGGQYSLVVDITKDGLTQIGTSDGGQPIYIFKDMTQKVAAKILSEVNARVKDGKSEYIYEGSGIAPYTADEFLKDRAVIIVEDGMGRMVVFKNRGNFEQGGCAKPVVYLYPEKTMSVSVQVGAKVTKSDPQYESDGWQNVTASPDGQLVYQGKSYDSLFWEGQGTGAYPDRSGSGVVVPRANVVGMMYLQLAQQGFNQKESSDFVNFWSLNMPSGNYVRLTWLSTQDMNQLAPLYISDSPTTMIRTFLEMEGMSAPKSLAPQMFHAPARNGFTVTEWGGLAINGLQSLSYPSN